MIIICFEAAPTEAIYKSCTLAVLAVDTSNLSHTLTSADLMQAYIDVGSAVMQEVSPTV